MSNGADVVRELVEQARRLPVEIEEMALALADKKQALHDLVQAKAQIEAGLAGEVAGEVDETGRKRYPNEESRKAEIARRLLENREYDEADRLLRATRQECIELEAKLDGRATSTGRLPLFSTCWPAEYRAAARRWWT